MPNNFRGRPMRWRWGAGYVNAADLPSVDRAIAYSEPRDGSDFAMTASGVEDAWTLGTDEFFEADLRQIPREDALTPYRTVGWNGAGGLQAAFKWARDKNILLVHPDARNLVVSPTMGTDGGGGVAADFVSSGAAAGLTRAIDVPTAAQRFDATAALAASTYWVQQDVRGVMAGEVQTLSGEYKVTGTVQARLILIAYDISNANIGQQSIGALTSAAFVRVACPALALPANTAYVRVHPEIVVPVLGNSGSVYWRNLMLERAGAASAAFIDNPVYPATLIDPMKGPPDLENSLLRRIHVKLRSSTSTPWDGY
jgi:hypothetical protein